MSLKYTSYFSGIGGFEVGIQKAIPQAKCVGYSEIEKNAIKVYSKNFPNHPALGDIIKIAWVLKKNGQVKKVNGKYVINEKAIRALPDFDFMVGGSPCQDLSIANINRKGLKGLQSRLFHAFLAIYRIKKPKYFILENVASMSKINRDKISKLLGCEPVQINSAIISAQNRNRLYWCNWPVDITKIKDRDLYFEDVIEKDAPAKYDLSEKALAYMDRTVKDGRTHWNFGLHHSTHDKKSKVLIANLRKGVPYNVLLAYSRSIRKTKTGSYDEKRFRVDGKANALVTGNGCGGSHSQNFIAKGARIRKLTPVECARLQTFPDNWHEGVSDSGAYHAYGNAVTTEVIYEIMKQHPLAQKRIIKKKLIKRMASVKLPTKLIKRM